MQNSVVEKTLREIVKEIEDDIDRLRKLLVK